MTNKLEIPIPSERSALADALSGDLAAYQALLGTEFGFTLPDQTIVNVAFGSLRFVYGSCGSRASARSSYPPGRRVQINPSTIHQVVAPYPADTLQ